MKVVFVENMYKTYMWEAVASQLEAVGYSTGWIVQNHVFSPCTKSEVCIIPYPKKKDKHLASKTFFSYVRSTDRIINYFGGGDEHYSFYYRKLDAAVTALMPDVMIGESTLFHEIMLIEICKRKKIPYLHPAATSYPSGRFSFYLYDAKVAVGGEKKSVDNDYCDKLIKGIAGRKVIPDYMRAPMVDESSRKVKHKSIRDRVNRLKGYYGGEKYNTPSPFKKLSMERKTLKLLKVWDTISTTLGELDDAKKIMFYPLQLQPEANLDVWGNKYNDQVKLLRDVAGSLPDGWSLVVKTNPKSKYEMSEGLLKLMRERADIIALDRLVPMADIFSQTDMVITVTGTIAIECVLSGKPLALLGSSIVDESQGCYTMESPKHISNFLLDLKSGKFQVANQQQKREVVQRMMKTSYPGFISDPMTNPSVMNSDNLTMLKNAFLDVFKKTIKQ